MDYREREHQRRQALGYDVDAASSKQSDQEKIIAPDRLSEGTAQGTQPRLIYKKKGEFTEENNDNSPPSDWLFEAHATSFNAFGYAKETRFFLGRRRERNDGWFEAIESCLNSEKGVVRAISTTIPADLLHLQFFAAAPRDSPEEDLHIFEIDGKVRFEVVEGEPGPRNFEGFMEGAYRGAYFIYEEYLRWHLQFLMVVSHQTMDQILSQNHGPRNCRFAAEIEFPRYARADDYDVWDEKKRRRVLLLNRQDHAMLKALRFRSW